MQVLIKSVSQKMRTSKKAIYTYSQILKLAGNPNGKGPIAISREVAERLNCKIRIDGKNKQISFIGGGG